MDLKALCEQVNDLAKDVGSFIRKEVKRINANDIETKGEHDLVTYVDKTAEKRIVEGLQKLLPEAGFIVEENTIEDKNKKYTWIVDPLDGTTNFIHAIPCFSISIALQEEDRTVLGVVYEINMDECFYAWKKGGAYLNGEKISVSKENNLDKALIATGFPYNDFSLLDEYLNFFKELMISTRGVRRLGSAAVDLAYVACGRFDAFYEYSLNPWDVAAGAFIVEEAGGRVADFKNGKDYIFGEEIIASNQGIFQDFYSKLSKYIP